MDESKEKQALQNIKSIVDACFNKTIQVTLGNDDFDTENHQYDLYVIIGTIANHVYSGLGLTIPYTITNRKEENEYEAP